MDLSVRVGEVELPNPVMTASGTSGHGAELGAFIDLSALGAVVVKSLSARAWPGNPAPRLAPAAAGMLNSVGLQGPGMAAWLRDELPSLLSAGARVVVSVWGRSPGEFAEAGEALARGLAPLGRASGPGQAARSGPVAAPGRVVAVEANISCPNVEDRQRMFAHSPEGTTAAISALFGVLEPAALPVWAKLSPNVTDLLPIAQAALEAGASALTLVNTLMGMAVDPVSARPVLGAGGGGLSGPALHPVAVRAVWECHRAFPDAPIVGVGGITKAEDAAELLAAGANAVQVGTASFADPAACARVLSGLEHWCRGQGVQSISELRERWLACRLG